MNDTEGHSAEEWTQPSNGPDKLPSEGSEKLPPDGATNVVSGYSYGTSVSTNANGLTSAAVRKDGANEYENTLAGAVGAFLFALIGGGVAFVLSLLGYVAALSGLITMVLAVFGYKLFSGTRSSGITSKKALIISIIITVIVLFIAEYCSWSYELLKQLLAEGYTGVTYFDCMRVFPEALKDGEILSSFLLSLLLSYLFAALGCVSYVRRMTRR